MTRSRFTGDAARATRSRARAADPRPTVPVRLRPPPLRCSQCAEPLEPRRLLSTFTVTTTDDEGPGSLRQAILDANALAGSDEIRFSLGAGLQVISVRSRLPDVTDPLTIDGSLPPDVIGQQSVEIDGPNTQPGFDGLTLRANTTVRALSITRFGRRGVVFAAGGGRLEGCYVGVAPSGSDSLSAGNALGGVAVNAPGVTIGGTEPFQRNVISANNGPGIFVSGGERAVIEGNLVGLSARGTRAQGNRGFGIVVESTFGVRIGGTSAAARNVISGNTAGGVSLLANASDVVVQGNFIGTDASGAAAVPNGSDSGDIPSGVGIGVAASNVTIGGSSSTAGNIISANFGGGVSVNSASGVIIGGNYIGTNAAGIARLGTQRHGVRINGAAEVLLGRNPTERNVISGNAGSGVLLEGNNLSHDFITIGYNHIGTNAAGDAAVGNGWDARAPFRDGVTSAVTGVANILIGSQHGPSRHANVISCNGGAGVRVNFGEVRGNFIGTNAAGNAALGNGAEGLVLEPQGLAEGNVISGNLGSGVRMANVRFGGASLSGNFIGTDFTGSIAVPNRGNGVEIIESQAGVTGTSNTRVPTPNVISGNLGHGVLVVAKPVAGQYNGSDISGNYIGTDATGTQPLGNGGSRVYVAATGASVIDNVISANRGNGLTITEYPGTPTSNNFVYRNGIGTNPARSLSYPGLGNAGHGIVLLNTARNEIGREFEQQGNTIAFNGGSGIAVQTSPVLGAPFTAGVADGNLISANSIFANGGLGIDLASDGVTPNDPLDADSGPNRLQNFPMIQSLTPAGTSSVTVRYTLDSEPNTIYTVEFFSSPEPDPSGHGEGRAVAGSASVRTDAAGHAAGTRTLGNIAGTWLTATATATGGGTSEFSPAVRVPGPAVVGRWVFYNNSAFDDHNRSANEADDGAVATDKRALLPWETASFANVTGYDRGINGVMIDIAGLPANSTLTPADFAFRSYRPPRSMDNVGIPERPLFGAWEGAPSPSLVTVRRGAGAGGSDRVTLVWNDRGTDLSSLAVLNRWLEVTVKPSARTGLAQPDMFYFGNLAGETGDMEAGPGDEQFQVNAIDLAGTRRAIGSAAPITSQYDHNRDGAVNALDVAAVRANRGRFLPLPRPPVPATTAPPVVIFATDVLREDAAVDVMLAVL